MPAEGKPEMLENAGIDRFFDQVHASNPFTDNRVNGPRTEDVDVDHIHQPQFQRLVTLAREARDERRGLGVVLWGEAGIGKSHLLARLSRWAQHDKNACLVYLHNLQASPENLPRSLLKSMLSILTRGWVHDFHRSPLFWMVNAALCEALKDNRKPQYLRSEAEAAYRLLIDQLSSQEPSQAALVDRAVYGALFQFFCSAVQARRRKGDEHVAGLAVRWLSGDFLDPDEARKLDLPTAGGHDEPVALADNQQIKQVLVALAQMALFLRQPLVLCFDQIDNLDQEQAAALSRFLQALIDSAPNLLVVWAGVQATLVHWRNQKVIQDSAWDRLAQFEIGLQRIAVTEGRAIVAARLDKFLQPFAHLTPVSQYLRDNALFPLGNRWEQEFLNGKVEVRPRDVINWAREGWHREQELLKRTGGPAWLANWAMPRAPDGTVLPPTPEQVREAIDRGVAQKMAEHVAQRQAEPYTLAPNADNLTGLVATLLEQCVEADLPRPVLEVQRLPAPRYGSRSPYDLIVRQYVPSAETIIRIGVLCLATSSAYSAVLALRRLVRDADPPDLVLLITDEREPLHLGARGQEYYDELRHDRSARFQHIELSFHQYAELVALQAVVGLARSGDLEIELPGGRVQQVSEQEVIASHHRQGRYSKAAVLRDVLTERQSKKLKVKTKK